MKYISHYYILYVCILIEISAYGMLKPVFEKIHEAPWMEISRMLDQDYVKPKTIIKTNLPIRSINFNSHRPSFIDYANIEGYDNDSTALRTPELHMAIHGLSVATAYGHNLYIREIDTQRYTIIDLLDYIKPLKKGWALEVKGLSPDHPFLAIIRSESTQNTHRIEIYNIVELCLAWAHQHQAHNNN